MYQVEISGLQNHTKLQEQKKYVNGVCYFRTRIFESVKKKHINLG